MRIKTVAEGLAQRSDNFLLLRFIAASLVIYGHAPAVSPMHAPLDLFWQLNWGEYSGAIAVDIFFVISGFLITGSYLRRQHLGNFLWARLLRIMPAYAICLGLCALVIGPIFSYKPVADYFTDRAVYHYFWGNIQLTQETLAWHLPGVFAPNRDNAINGSIWTLPAEAAMYVWVAALGLSTILRRRLLFNVTVLALLIYGFIYPDRVWLLGIPEYMRLAALFAVGAFCYVNRDYIPTNGAFLVAAMALGYVTRSLPVYTYVFALCEVLFVFWFAYGTRWTGYNRFGDYSYGIYLWGFPSQQIVVSLFPDLPVLANAACGFALALPIAVASWHFIENPALGLKTLPRQIVDAVTRKKRASSASQDEATFPA